MTKIEEEMLPREMAEMFNLFSPMGLNIAFFFRPNPIPFYQNYMYHLSWMNSMFYEHFRSLKADWKVYFRNYMNSIKPRKITASPEADSEFARDYANHLFNEFYTAS